MDMNSKPSANGAVPRLAARALRNRGQNGGRHLRWEVGSVPRLWQFGVRDH
jgi:hypothetical protein